MYEGHDETPASERRAPRRLRAVLLGAIGFLYVLSVPWYRSDDQGLRILLGLPDWVAVAVLCYAAVAVLNALAWWLTDIDDQSPLPDVLSSAEGDAEAEDGR